MRKICVTDGQGGGIGSTIIRKVKEAFEEVVTVIALGTNALATVQLLKARANRGASGEHFRRTEIPERLDSVSVHAGKPGGSSQDGLTHPRAA